MELVTSYRHDPYEENARVDFALLNTGRGIAIHPAVTMSHPYFASNSLSTDNNQMQRATNVLSMAGAPSSFDEMHFTENLPLIIHPNLLNHFAHVVIKTEHLSAVPTKRVP